LLHKPDEIPALFVAQLGQKGTVAGLQVGGGHAELSTTGSHSQPGGDGHLVALHTPHFQDPGIVSLEL